MIMLEWQVKTRIAQSKWNVWPSTLIGGFPGEQVRKMHDLVQVRRLRKRMRRIEGENMEEVQRARTGVKVLALYSLNPCSIARTTQGPLIPSRSNP